MGFAWTIERLAETHDRRSFRCGTHQLDNYFRKHALDNDRRGLGRTYVATQVGTGKVLGFLSLCTNSVQFETVPVADLPRYPIPTLLVARLAVDRSAQGVGVGSDLLLAALEIAVKVADQVGVFAVTVDAMNDEAKVFYRKKFGFSELLDDPRHLFVTIADLRASGFGLDP